MSLPTGHISVKTDVAELLVNSGNKARLMAVQNIFIQ